MHPASGPPVALFVLCALQPTDSLQQQYFRPACQAKTRRLGEATQEIGGTAPASPVQLVPTVAACRLLLYYSTPIAESEAPPGLSQEPCPAASLSHLLVTRRGQTRETVCVICLFSCACRVIARRIWAHINTGCMSVIVVRTCPACAHQFWT